MPKKCNCYSAEPTSCADCNTRYLMVSEDDARIVICALKAVSELINDFGIKMDTRRVHGIMSRGYADLLKQKHDDGRA